MNDKKNAIFTIGIIASMILIFTVADFVKKDRLFSETENRILTSRPEFSKEALLDGTYTEDYESYVTDQFVGRDKWIALKTVTDILMQKKEINGIYLGEDGYLIEQHKPVDYTPESEQQKLQLLEKLVNRWNAKVMLVPTADNILTDKMPANAVYYDETRLLADVKELVGEDNYIDVYSELRKHSDEEIYYRTDHHWTGLGAYYGYEAWRKNVKRLPLVRNVEGMETVTEEFLGTLHSRINLPMAGDKIQIFPETVAKPVTVTYDFAKTADSFYEEKYLDTKNKYGYFLDDNHAFVEIQTSGYHNGKTLFVIKDSYANSMIPLLAQHYEKIYVLDLRYFNGRLFSFMEQYVSEKTDVLVLYNCIHFLEDFKYVE